jgi:hypothetical protein
MAFFVAESRQDGRYHWTRLSAARPHCECRAGTGPSRPDLGTPGQREASPQSATSRAVPEQCPTHDYASAGTRESFRTGAVTRRNPTVTGVDWLDGNGQINRLSFPRDCLLFCGQIPSPSPWGASRDSSVSSCRSIRSPRRITAATACFERGFPNVMPTNPPERTE